MNIIRIYIDIVVLQKVFWIDIMVSVLYKYIGI